MLFFWFSASLPSTFSKMSGSPPPFSLQCYVTLWLFSSIFMSKYVQLTLHSSNPQLRNVSALHSGLFPPLYINNAIAAFFWINLLSSVPGDLPETWISKRPTSLARGDKGTMITPTGSGFPTQFCEWRKTRLSNAAASPGTSGSFQGPHSRED